jgi:hypothetical protein
MFKIILVLGSENEVWKIYSKFILALSYSRLHPWDQLLTVFIRKMSESGAVLVVVVKKIIQSFAARK